MVKAALKINLPEHKNRLFRFTPMMSMGNIITVISIVIGGTTVYMQMQNQIDKTSDGLNLVATTLKIENEARKNEIKEGSVKADLEREEFYKKMAENQVLVHEEIRDLTSNMGSRFDRLDDKLDKKQDKK